VAEVPLAPAVVTEHQAHGSHCPDCGHCTWSEIPADVRAHVFGPNLTALVAYLSVFCRGSKRIIEEFIETVFQIPLSLGTVANLEQETCAALSEPYQEAQQAVRAAAVKNTDETGWRQANQKRWLWLAATQTAACFKVCVGRGKTALSELLGEAIQGVVCSPGAPGLVGLPFLGLGISPTVLGASKTRLPEMARSGRRSGRRNRSGRSGSRPPGLYALA
jgi:transposase